MFLLLCMLRESKRMSYRENSGRGLVGVAFAERIQLVKIGQERFIYRTSTQAKDLKTKGNAFCVRGTTK